MYDAIILAGGENSKNLSAGEREPFEAMIRIAGKPMVAFVAEALSGCPRVGRIFILGPEEALATCPLPERARIMAGGRTIIDTIVSGMNALGHRRKTIVATADIPLLTSAAVEDFLAQCDRTEADLYYPVVTREVNERRFPGNRRTYVRLREGTFTGGNLFLVNPAVVPGCVRVADRLIAQRKNPLRLAAILGWTFVFKFLAGRLSIVEVERRVAELLGVRGAVIQSPYAELGIDVDKPSDLEMVRATFSLPRA